MSVYSYWKSDGSLAIHGFDEKKLQPKHMHWLELCASLVGTEEYLRVDGRTGDVHVVNHFFNIFTKFEVHFYKQDDGFVDSIREDISFLLCGKCKAYGSFVLDEFLAGRPNKGHTTCDCEGPIFINGRRLDGALAPVPLYRVNPKMDGSYPLSERPAVVPTHPRLLAFKDGEKIRVIGINRKMLTPSQKECVNLLAELVSDKSLLFKNVMTGKIVPIQHRLTPFIETVWSWGPALTLAKLERAIYEEAQKNNCCSKMFRTVLDRHKHGKTDPVDYYCPYKVTGENKSALLVQPNLYSRQFHECNRFFAYFTVGEDGFNQLNTTRPPKNTYDLLFMSKVALFTRGYIKQRSDGKYIINNHIVRQFYNNLHSHPVPVMREDEDGKSWCDLVELTKVFIQQTETCTHCSGIRRARHIYACQPTSTCFVSEFKRDTECKVPVLNPECEIDGIACTFQLFRTRSSHYPMNVEEYLDSSTMWSRFRYPLNLVRGPKCAAMWLPGYKLMTLGITTPPTHENEFRTLALMADITSGHLIVDENQRLVCTNDFVQAFYTAFDYNAIDCTRLSGIKRIKQIYQVMGFACDGYLKDANLEQRHSYLKFFEWMDVILDLGLAESMEMRITKGIRTIMNLSGPKSFPWSIPVISRDRQTVLTNHAPFFIGLNTHTRFTYPSVDHGRLNPSVVDCTAFVAEGPVRDLLARRLSLISEINRQPVRPLYRNFDFFRGYALEHPEKSISLHYIATNLKELEWIETLTLKPRGQRGDPCSDLEYFSRFRRENPVDFAQGLMDHNRMLNNMINNILQHDPKKKHLCIELACQFSAFFDNNMNAYALLLRLRCEGYLPGPHPPAPADPQPFELWGGLPYSAWVEAFQFKYDTLEDLLDPKLFETDPVKVRKEFVSNGVARGLSVYEEHRKLACDPGHLGFLPGMKISRGQRYFNVKRGKQALESDDFRDNVLFHGPTLFRHYILSSFTVDELAEELESLKQWVNSNEAEVEAMTKNELLASVDSEVNKARGRAMITNKYYREYPEMVKKIEALKTKFEAQTHTLRLKMAVGSVYREHRGMFDRLEAIAYAVLRDEFSDIRMFYRETK